MKFHTRKLIKPGDLNANNTLFGGTLLKWIDEEAGIFSVGRTSLTFSCLVRSVFNKKVIISIERLVFVKIDENENSVPHGKTMEDFLT